MKAKEVLKFLKITRPTLCHYVRDGKLKVVTKGNGRYEYDDESVYNFAGIPYHKDQATNVVIYARTSNPPKKYVEEQVERLLQFCTSKGITVNKVFTDVKSGMNFDRKEFNQMLDMVFNNKIKLIVIENKDRLVRFGFDLLVNICKKHDCEIMIANDITEKNFEQELTEDLLSIIHYFSMKSYSNRRKLNKIKQEILNDNP